MKREIAACDHNKWLEAQAKLNELREEAFKLVELIFRRLVKSLDTELSDAALEGEHRLDRARLPIKQGNEWLMHHDVLCRALWSQRNEHSGKDTLCA
jgi:hypothetical protein